MVTGSFNTWTFLLYLAVTYTAHYFLPWPGSLAVLVSDRFAVGRQQF